MNRNYTGYEIIVAGDVNATIRLDCEPNSWKCVGNLHEGVPTSFNGSNLTEMAKEESLNILNTMYAPKHHRHSVTLKSNLGYEGRLGYIIVDGYVQRFSKN